MRSIVKLVLVVCIFSSVAFADGDMGNGGKTCTTNCFAANLPTIEDGKQPKNDDSVLSFVQEYLNSFFKYFRN